MRQGGALRGKKEVRYGPFVVGHIFLHSFGDARRSPPKGKRPSNTIMWIQWRVPGHAQKPKINSGRRIIQSTLSLNVLSTTCPSAPHFVYFVYFIYFVYSVYFIYFVYFRTPEHVRTRTPRICSNTLKQRASLGGGESLGEAPPPPYSSRCCFNAM